MDFQIKLLSTYYISWKLPKKFKVETLQDTLNIREGSSGIREHFRCLLTLNFRQEIKIPKEDVQVKVISIIMKTT